MEESYGGGHGCYCNLCERETRACVESVYFNLGQMKEDMNKDEPPAWRAEAQIQTHESNSPIAHV